MARMSTRIRTYVQAKGKDRANSPKADWLVVVSQHQGKKASTIVGPPTPENHKRALLIKEKLDKAQALGSLGHAALTSPTFKSMSDRYLKAGVKLHKLSPTSVKTQRTRLKVLNEEFADIHLDTITPELLMRWWEEFIISGKRTTATGQRYLSAISCVYQYATQTGHKLDNPAAGMRGKLRGISRTKADRQEDTRSPIETLDETEALLDASRELGCEYVHLMLLLMLDAGLRRGEAFATRRVDCQLGENMKDRSRVLAVVENRPMGFAAELPKSGRTRWVPMSWRIRCHVREFFALGSESKPLMGPWPHQQDYFQRKIFTDLSKAAGLGRRRPKDLRDTFASHLLTAGWDTTQIMRWMGHAPGSWAMFRNRYAKWISVKEEQAWRAPTVLLDWQVPTDLMTHPRVWTPSQPQTDPKAEPVHG
jgi:integrase